MIYKILAVASTVLAFYAFIPYLKDVGKGRVRPARSTRLMFVLLMVLSLLQQINLGSRGALGVTIGETLGAAAVLIISYKKGMGGLRRLDIICYFLLIIDLLLWAISKNALVALHLTVVADFIAFTPTIEKTWRDPESETVTFFALGAIAAFLSVLAARHYTYGVILYPASLTVGNIIEVILIKRHQFFGAARLK